MPSQRELHGTLLCRNGKISQSVMIEQLSWLSAQGAHDYICRHWWKVFPCTANLSLLHIKTPHAQMLNDHLSALFMSSSILSTEQIFVYI